MIGDLVQVLAVEGRACVCGDIERAQRLAALRIEHVQLVSAGKPDVLTIIGDATHAIDTRKWAIFIDDFCCCTLHGVSLAGHLSIPS
jgi:hypothetical protein